jgi:hypothetical protein
MLLIGIYLALLFFVLFARVELPVPVPAGNFRPLK